MKIIFKSTFQPVFSISHKLQYCRALSHFRENKEEQKHQQNEKNNYKEKFTSKSVLLGAATTSLLAYYYLVNEKQQRYVYAAKGSCKDRHGKGSDIPNPFRGCHVPGLWRPDLPTYTKGDVEKHNTMENRLWTSYKEGVYDITDFVVEHPGSNHIVQLAAGGPVEPFWVLYGFHEELPFILEKLETMRIGNLCKADQVKTTDFHDPFINEPERCKDIRPATLRPFNGAVRLDYLTKNFVTPVKWWYVRNHLLVPDIDAKNHNVTLEVEGTGKKFNFTLDEIKGMRKACVMITLMCSNNRKNEMMEVKGEKTANWGAGMSSNAVWTGVKLCDLLEKVGITAENYGNYKHVQFQGMDQEADGAAYHVSIPIWKAVDKKGDVLVAYLMNGDPLTRDHGYPIRMVVPGHIGARSCKWLTKIVVSEKEAHAHYQTLDYKSFGPSIHGDNADYENIPAVQAIPVYCVICTPQDKDSVKVLDGHITIKGYANAGGGNKIIRVDVSTDCGETWREAQLDFQDKGKDYPHNWAWTLWSCKIPIEKTQEEVEIWCKAVDTSNNTQPESFEHIFNFKGVICNAYHKIKLKLICM